MNMAMHIIGKFSILDAWIFPCVNLLFWNEQSRKFIILLGCGRLVNSNVANSVWNKSLLYLKQTYSMLLNCGLKIVWHEIYLFKFKTKCSTSTTNFRRLLLSRTINEKPRGVLLEMLAGGVPPGSQNPDLISTKKCHFPHPFSYLGPISRKSR